MTGVSVSFYQFEQFSTRSDVIHVALVCAVAESAHWVLLLFKQFDTMIYCTTSTLLRLVNTLYVLNDAGSRQCNRDEFV